MRCIQMEKKMGHYSFVIGVIIAVVLGLALPLGQQVNEWLTSILVILGLVVGFLNVTDLLIGSGHGIQSHIVQAAIDPIEAFIVQIEPAQLGSELVLGNFGLRGSVRGNKWRKTTDEQ